ncbi:MAG: DUF4340 domain-containing protein [Myxococcales bacterium]|nr:MAG: DUF4340 domain-containing protein [Myxococcales bacterium]
MKSVLVHATLAVIALLWAYQTWTHEEESEGPVSEVEIVDCDDSDLQEVSFTSENTFAKLDVRGKGDKKFLWIQSKNKTKNAPNQMQSFVGNEAADEFVNDITPLRAIRSLGTLSKKELKELGLKNSKDKLTLKCDGKTHTLMIGGSTFGSADRYAKFPKKNTVFLLKADLIRHLESAQTRLMQRNMQRFKFADVDEIVVKVDNKTRTLLHRDRREPAKAQWVDKANPTQRNELYGNWLKKVEALRAQRYLAPKQSPNDLLKDKQVKAEPALILEFIAEGKSIGHFEMLQATAEVESFYGKSDATRSWVELITSSAKQVTADARPVVGLEAMPSQSSIQSIPQNPHAHP